jgi:hypothetical protein
LKKNIYRHGEANIGLGQLVNLKNVSIPWAKSSAIRL